MSEAACSILCLPDLRQPIECGTDEMMLFGSTDLDGHLARDFSSAYHKHPAPSQLLPGNFVHGLALLRVVGGQILVFTELGTDGHIAKPKHLFAVAPEQAGSRLLRSADVCERFVHDGFFLFYPVGSFR